MRWTASATLPELAAEGCSAIIDMDGNRATAWSGSTSPDHATWTAGGHQRVLGCLPRRAGAVRRLPAGPGCLHELDPALGELTSLDAAQRTGATELVAWLRGQGANTAAGRSDLVLLLIDTDRLSSAGGDPQGHGRAGAEGLRLALPTRRRQS
jgi:hypothetical protein